MDGAKAYKYPKADLPVFQISIDYHQPPQYYYDLRQQLKKLHEKGVLKVAQYVIQKAHNFKILSTSMRALPPQYLR